METKLVTALTEVLERANYIPVPQDCLQQALEEGSLIDLKTDIDFDDFEHVICYYRGEDSQTLKTKRWFWHKEIELNVLKQVFVFLLSDRSKLLTMFGTMPSTTTFWN